MRPALYITIGFARNRVANLVCKLSSRWLPNALNIHLELGPRVATTKKSSIEQALEVSTRGATPSLLSVPKKGASKPEGLAGNEHRIAIVRIALDDVLLQCFYETILTSVEEILWVVPIFT